MKTRLIETDSDAEPTDSQGFEIVVPGSGATRSRNDSVPVLAIDGVVEIENDVPRGRNGDIRCRLRRTGGRGTFVGRKLLGAHRSLAIGSDRAPFINFRARSAP